MKKYDPQKIEKKWQKEWEGKRFYSADDNSSKPKYYQLETFPYPSAAGLHMGHPKGYIAEDVHARFKRMNGFEVLYTMGWDAFGLPTENYAIKVGKSPKEVAKENIKNFKRQVKMFGLSYDWEREINTSEPEYYKWTQWIFLQLYKAGLAFKKQAKVNWCPQDQTVLANEQVVDGKCERCGHEVIQKEMDQWFFKITDYAERLLEDLKGLDWTEETIKRQEDWIGKSEGTTIKFKVLSFSPKIEEIEVFTTRPDTIFGATYLVLAPEHPIIKQLKFANKSEVEAYIEQAKRKTELMRKEGAGEKTGVELKGVRVINPANKEEISIWVADYVLGSYGTGAIMGVPAHDQRDFDFAKKFDLKVKKVIEDNILVNSGQFDGMDSEKAAIEITKFVGGETKTQYKLRDWSVSRQRYWGVPIPMIYCEKCGMVPVPEKDLPVKLPDLKDYRPQGMPPLASSEKFLKTKCPNCAEDAKRDAETLDTFVDSSWYYLRYVDPKNEEKIFDSAKVDHWLPVDLYLIGAEHVTAHLLYARFVTEFLFDQGYLKFKEPFIKLRHQGMILGPDGRRMSKRWGNVINPDDFIGEYGADTARLYEMFMGPFESSQPWDTAGVVGVFRFLSRIWSFAHGYSENSGEAASQTVINKAIKKIGEDIAGLKFNTAVSELMKLLNHLEESQVDKEVVKTYTKLLAPFAPHLAEEIWREVLGNKESIHLEKWPEYDEKYLEEENIDLVVQINGKTRNILKVARDSTEEKVKELALASEKIKRHLEGKEIKKVIFISNRLINLILD